MYTRRRARSFSLSLSSAFSSPLNFAGRDRERNRGGGESAGDSRSTDALELAAEKKREDLSISDT